MTIGFEWVRFSFSSVSPRQYIPSTFYCVRVKADTSKVKLLFNILFIFTVYLSISHVSNVKLHITQCILSLGI